MKRMYFTTEDTEVTECGGDMETRRQGDLVSERVSLSPSLLVFLSALLRVLCVLCGYVAVVVGVNAAPQEVVPVEGAAFAAELVSVSADGVVTFRRIVREGIVAEATAPSGGVASAVAEKAEVRTLQLDELVRWGNPVAPRARTVVVLADGGQLMTAADWSGGAAVRLEGEKIVVRSDQFGEVPLARGMVRGVVFAQQQHARDREELVGRVRNELSPIPSIQRKGNSDVVLLSNGDRVTGTLGALARGSLTIETDAGAAKLPLSRVDAVALGAPSQPSPNPSLLGRGVTVVGLRDGSLMYANEVLANEKELKLTLGKSVTLRGGNVGDVVFMQSFGDRAVYLSDLEPADYRHVPYLNIDWPYKRDRNVLGEPLAVNGKLYLKGIGMHSAGRLSYRLDDKYKRFEAAVAIDDSADGRGSVTFGVYVLRDGKWNEAYKSGIVRGGDAPQPVSVDVSGAQGLTLTVDYADRGDELDRADWLDARLVK